jgi:N-acetylglutamate synthase-like GNAT family acetyltransferase
MLQIRKIKPEDIDFVLELAKELGCPEGKLLAHIENFLICESDRIKCGCGCLVPLGSTGLISWVMIRESHRGQKLGGAIIKALLNIADLRGIKEVYAAGICGEFLTAMGFVKFESKDGMEHMGEILGDVGMECYKVSLEGYFKTCSQK